MLLLFLVVPQVWLLPPHKDVSPLPETLTPPQKSLGHRTDAAGLSSR